MAFVKYRIVFSQQAQKFKIQYRDILTLFLWSDLEYKLFPGDTHAFAHQFDSAEEVTEQLEKMVAYDWVVVK